MPLRTFVCEFCGYERQTFKKEPQCNHNQDEEGIPFPMTAMKAKLEVPQLRFTETTDKDRGKKALVGQQKDLKARARAHSRDVEMEDFIQTNNDETAYAAGWLTKDGKKRRAIDDK